MSLQKLRDEFPEFARDTKINLGTVLTVEGAPGLTLSQIWLIAAASSYATKSPALIEAVVADGSGTLTDEALNAAKGAASIMAMNNIYYRAQHLIDNAELTKMPARLRMNIIGKPGIEKVDFELACLAVSAISGCGNCLAAHSNEVTKSGVSLEAVHSTIRIASVLNSAAQVKAIIGD